MPTEAHHVRYRGAPRDSTFAVRLAHELPGTGRARWWRWSQSRVLAAQGSATLNHSQGKHVKGRGAQNDPLTVPPNSLAHVPTTRLRADIF